MAKVNGLNYTQPDTSSHNTRVSWNMSKSHIAGFYVDEEYALTLNSKGEFVWTSEQNSPVYFTKGNSQVTGGYAITYNAPDNALAAQVRVKPKSTTHKVKEKDKDGKEKEVEKSYWSGSWTDKKQIDFRSNPLQPPSMSLNFDQVANKVTVSVTTSDADAKSCRIYAEVGGRCTADDDHLALFGGAYTKVYNVAAGTTYAFYAMVRSNSDKASSAWTAAQYVTTKPAAPSINYGSAKAVGTSGITMSWGAVSGAVTYTVEYVADDPAYFLTNRSAVTTVTGVQYTSFVQNNLELGHVYYMRVQAVNATGESAWSAASSGVSLATIPDPPTTYDTFPAYRLSDSVRIKWTHNSEDASTQTAAKIKLEVNGSSTVIDVSGNVSEKLVNLGSVTGITIADGATVSWSVCTKGAHVSYGPYSGTRSFLVYETPTLQCTLSQSGDPVDNLGHPLESLPLTVSFDASGGGGLVSGYHITVKAGEDIEVEALDGTVTYITEGSVVHESDYDTSEDPYYVDLGVEANLPDACELSLIAEVCMQSGLRAESNELPFHVDFGGDIPEPVCSATFDAELLTADVTCAVYEVGQDGVETDVPMGGISLSVYRIEQDGSLTLIASGLDNTGGATVIDPHAGFRECGYRVVATDMSTGMHISSDCSDSSPHPTCVVQWNESWDRNVDADEDRLGYSYVGNRIDGLYNLNLDESSSMQSEDAEYIGRKHPVSYYGTQRGHRASYAVEFPKSDTETLAKCRRLIDYPGDVYVRDPSGLGFWARVDSPTIGRGYDSQAVRFSFTAVHVEHQESSVI